MIAIYQTRIKKLFVAGLIKKSIGTSNYHLILTWRKQNERKQKKTNNDKSDYPGRGESAL